MTSDKINTILDKQLTRKQFLGVLGLGILSLTSLSSFIEQLNKTYPSSGQPTANYNHSTYGSAPTTKSLGRQA